MRRKIIVSMACLLMSSIASAGPFSITNRSCTGSLGAGTCNSIAQQAMNEMETIVNNDLPDADATTYSIGMSNAGVAAGKGIGSDYANDLDFMMVSANVSFGADLGNQSLSDFISGDAEGNQVRGAGVNASLTVGLDLGILPVDKIGFIDLEKMDVFFNFMSFDDGEPGDDLSAEIKTFGIHARYHLLEGKSILPGGLLKWGGLFVTTGIEKSKLNMSFVETFSETDTSNGITSTYSGTAKFGADVDVTSIPIEFTTYIQTLYVLTFYGGLGIDFNFGESSTIGVASGTINGSTTAGGGGTVAGNATLDLTKSGDPESTFVRGILGLQINIPLVKVYVQANKTLTGDEVAQVAGGIKVIW